MTSIPSASPASQQLAAKLAALQKKTDVVVGATARVGSTSLQDQLKGLTRETLAVAGVDQDQERATRLQIISARFGDVRKMHVQDEKDLADLATNLSDLLTSLSDEHAALKEPTPQERQLIADAEQALADARTEAAKKGFFAGFTQKNRDQALAEANHSLTEIRKRVERMGRDRLMKADLGSSLQTIMMMTRKVMDLTEARKVTTQRELDNAGVQRQARQAELQEFSAKSETLQTLKTEATAAVSAQELTLSGLQTGTPQYAAAEAELNDLKSKAEEAEGLHNVVLGQIRETQKFALEWQTHEATQRRIRDSQELCTELLRISVFNRHQTVVSLLEAERAFSDIEASATLKRSDDQISLRQMTRMAALGSAVGNEIAETVESMPAKLAELERVREAQEESTRNLRGRFNAAIEKLYEDSRPADAA